MEYELDEVSDFLNTDRFVQWVLSGEGDAYWQEVLATYPAKRTTIETARQLILELQQAETPAESPIAEEQVWNQIQQRIDTPRVVPMLRRPVWWQPALRWAAVVVCLLGIGWWTWPWRSAQSSVQYAELIEKAQEQTPLIERVNTGNQPLLVRLDDGSVITLEKNSRVSYPARFNPQKREVFLSGRALFSVSRRPHQPFYVYANEVVTKVLGTRFWVNAPDDGRQVSVQVQSGRVSVYKQSRINLADSETTGLVLLPNQEAVFNRTEETLVKKLAENPQPVVAIPMQQKQRFDEVAVPVILQALQQQYGIPILYNEELLARCIITTTLGTESLNDKLELICQTIGASYHIIDAQIVIEAPGCP